MAKSFESVDLHMLYRRVMDEFREKDYGEQDIEFIRRFAEICTNEVVDDNCFRSKLDMIDKNGYDHIRKCKYPIPKYERHSFISVTIIYGLFDITEILINRGMEVNEHTHQTHPLYEAILWNNTKIIKLLIDNGIDFRLGRYRYHSIRMIIHAIKMDNIEVVEMLLSYLSSRIIDYPIIKYICYNCDKIDDLLYKGSYDKVLDHAIEHNNPDIIKLIKDFSSHFDLINSDDRFKQKTIHTWTFKN